MIGAARIASTYLVLNHTMDEPSFISCGLEWLTQRTYTYMPEQPPLSHIAAGAGAWLAGARNVSKAGFEAFKAPNVLYESPSYYRTLALRRKWDWTVRRRLSLLAAAAICAGLVWAGYWFSFAPLVQGIHDAQEHINYGHTSYLFGETRDHGWWYFFPVVLLYKTPLAFLVLAALACVWLRRSPREHWTPLACAVAILISVLPSSIDIGIRHILPIYALLAIPAGLAAARLIESPSRAPRILGGFLVLWQLVASARAHPDYI